MLSYQNLGRPCLLAAIFALACSSSNPAENWDAALTASASGTVVIGAAEYSSSSKVNLSFSGPSETVDHFLITATSVEGNHRITKRLAAAATETELTGLRSSTSYKIEISACADASCVGPIVGTGTSTQWKSAEEIWQIAGQGASLDGITRIVSDGNVMIHAMVYGGDAPAAQAGRAQLYYGPMGEGHRGLAIATGDAVAKKDASSVSAFTSLAGQSGLHSPGTASTSLVQIATGQAVPLGEKLGGAIRLFFEALGPDQKTRIYYIDSKDGYVGRDFHSGPATMCSSEADYQPQGPCEPTLVVGVEGDAAGNSKIDNARQFKIGIPTLDDWRWSGAVGSFMIFTAGRIDGCSDQQRNNAYALWDGNTWVVQYDAQGCPLLFADVQAPSPLHLGGADYKLYFGTPSDQEGKVAASKLPFLGPKKVLYGSGAAEVSSEAVAYEGWEERSQARDITFLWPNGEVLDQTEEGYIDDFTIITPTADLDFQVLYIAITDGNDVPFASMAVLVNP